MLYSGPVSPAFCVALHISDALKFPIFSIWLAPRPAAAKRTFAGAITYGAVDSAHCGPIISSVLVNSANFYKFKVGPPRLIQ